MNGAMPAHAAMLSVDPGTRCSGAALWFNGRLYAAAPIVNLLTKGSGPRECAYVAQQIWRWVEAQISMVVPSYPATVVCEYPQIYQRAGGKSKADPNNQLPLACIDGALAAYFPAAQIVVANPHDWKGGVEKPKKVSEPYPIESKVRSRLLPEEIIAFEKHWPKNGKHSWDLTDAVGVGLHALGRFERVRALARE